MSFRTKLRTPDAERAAFLPDPYYSKQFLHDQNCRRKANGMDNSGKRWTVQDRYGNFIYLTQERWEHIIDETGHPELEPYEEWLKTTIKEGRRKQEPLNLRKHRYYHLFDDLPDDVNHLVAIVLFTFDIDANGQSMTKNFIATAFFKHFRLKV